jgi:hypothetical protein
MNEPTGKKWPLSKIVFHGFIAFGGLVNLVIIVLILLLYFGYFD